MKPQDKDEFYAILAGKIIGTAIWMKVLQLILDYIVFPAIIITVLFFAVLFLPSLKDMQGIPIGIMVVLAVALAMLKVQKMVTANSSKPRNMMGYVDQDRLGRVESERRHEEERKQEGEGRRG
jgi:hypothetical protein